VITVEKLLDAASLTRAHHELMEPNFPPSELISADELVDLVSSGRGMGLALVDDKVFRGVAAMQFYEGDMCVLTYLAVASVGRSKGYGMKLLSSVLGEAALLGHSFILAEVEPPDTSPASPEHGDPDRRVRFYARFGARALAVEHWQPPVSPQYGPVPLTLIALPTSEAGLPTITSTQIERLEREYHGGELPAGTRASLAVGPVVETLDLVGMYQG
jgi:GNAT superfamily N-acetyltransferase